MTIEKMWNGTELVVALEGRLDTTTSPDLENMLMEAIPEAETLVFDLEDLDYISSAGLRVLLWAQKKMTLRGRMKVKNVKEDIMDVFSITGFTEILDIEQDEKNADEED